MDGQAGGPRWTAVLADRREAGRQLAERLARYRDRDPVVLAIPRGGVVVGYEIARALGAPLDVMVARKIGAPDQPEFGIGAIAPGGVELLDADSVRLAGATRADLDRISARERAELDRRLRRYRGERPLPDLRGKTAIVVDDGIATGVTMRASLSAIRALAAERVVLAVGVAPPETLEALRGEVDDVVCLVTPSNFYAVGLHFGEFPQVSDDEVVELLRLANTAAPAHPR